MIKGRGNVVFVWCARAAVAVLLAVGLATPAGAVEVRTTFVETFETGTNEGEWTFGTGNEFFVDMNGNPGRYLRDSSLVTFTPRASTSFGVASAFTGDYRARGVESVGIDLAIASASGNVSSRTLSLILLNDNGTPFDLADDFGAYTVTSLPLPPVGVAGLNSPTDILQWVSYDIPVPSQANSLPAGWSWISRNTLRPSGGWARLVRDVDHLGFIFGDPALLYPLFNWDVALDNPRITTVQVQ
jgi:hypothetical protein